MAADILKKCLLHLIIFVLADKKVFQTPPLRKHAGALEQMPKYKKTMQHWTATLYLYSKQNQ